MIRRTIYLVSGVVVGAGCFYLWAYLNTVHYRVPSPNVNKLAYLLIQIPPLWLAYATAVFFCLFVLSFVLGRTVLFKKAYERATERLHWKTRNAFLWWKGKSRELEGKVEELTAERNALAEMAQEFQSQLIAIDKVRTFRPRNEIVEKKLLDSHNVVSFK
ncbi:MAG: hypothetical protein Unbinned6201contig1000_15 [Prokaryotic dsDNA virus sp.]|nr:MAG: hypothetical protein Unbinned6201contig1000_15 [Prokaryotic dsDNA virus sp.]|tara:strand:- start:3082 stop:3561 length:480 start_codon:yes stop_codon:yes gene_type:complete